MNTQYGVEIMFCRNCLPEACIILETNVTSINLIQRGGGKALFRNPDIYGNVTTCRCKYLTQLKKYTQQTNENVCVLNSSLRFTILLVPGLNIIPITF